jgi:ParB family transcriptional regulator, chromosome partitioning protein
MGSSITTVSIVREIPLNKLVPSKDNVRKTYRPDSIAELAEDIASHGLLQNLLVRPALDDENRETGKYEVPAGGRRLAALKLLAKQKRIPKNVPVTCNVREDGGAKELSLAENIARENLHPADEFVAFRELHEEQGLGAEEIAARFGRTARTVRQRLKLGAVSPKLMELYRLGEMTLDQIMAFTVTDDHTRQEQVWESPSFNASPEYIRRNLLQSHVPARDRRVSFIGLAAYEAAGGGVLRDLFVEDNGGYLTDAGLVDRLVRARLEQEAERIRGEGWKWVDVAPEFPHGHGLRRIYPQDVELAPVDISRLEEIEAELDALGADSESAEVVDPARDAKIAGLNAEYGCIDARGRVFEPDDVARSGAILSIDSDGSLSITRGLARPEDEPQSTQKADIEGGGCQPSADIKEAQATDETEDRLALSDRLVMDLTAQRTMALRDRLGANADLALTTLTNALAHQLFYHAGRSQSCLGIHASSGALEGFAPEIDDGPAGRSIAVRHEIWATQMPRDADDLWIFVSTLGAGERNALLAHCIGLTVDAIQRPGTPKSSLIPADTLAVALNLNMRDYWTPTAAAYLERVSKAAILDAVREGVSQEASNLLVRLKKPEMAQAAEQMLAATTWLPKPLRSPSTADETRREEVLSVVAE